jgi:hypothetical protein
VEAAVVLVGFAVVEVDELDEVDVELLELEDVLELDEELLELVVDVDDVVDDEVVVDVDGVATGTQAQGARSVSPPHV